MCFCFPDRFAVFIWLSGELAWYFVGHSLILVLYFVDRDTFFALSSFVDGKETVA